MDLDQFLTTSLAALEQKALYRKLRPLNKCAAIIQRQGRELANFASNDYLGLAQHPKVIQAIKAAVDQLGAGSGASRLLSGSLEIHHELEHALAAYKKTEAALLFSTGFACALGVLPALADEQAVIVLDKLVHASLVDAARLSRATIRVFKHNDLADLEEKLQWASEQSKRIIVVAESIYSMDGDKAPLAEMAALKNRFGAWLFLDEAHATAVFGSGLAAQEGVTRQVEIHMGTLGKALGNSGGFICGSHKLIDYLVNRARSFIYSTAPPPHVSAGALAALQIAASPEGDSLRQSLWQNVRLFRPEPLISQIIPVHIGEDKAALAAAERLEQSGIFAPAIRYPTVGRGSARIRLSFTAAHTSAQIDAVKHALSSHA